MSTHRSTNLLLVLIALLLLANLARPLFQPKVAFAQQEAKQETVAISGSGSSAWVLKGGEIYYIQFETQYDRIRIVGPEELP